MVIEQISIIDIEPYKNNARVHSGQQVKQLANSIKKFGFNNPILIDENNGVIAGHGRLEAAKTLGLEEVPCIKLEHLTEAQKKAYIIADNKIALNSSWNEDLLKLELEEIKELDFDAKLTGFSVREMEKIFDTVENKYTKKIETPYYEPTLEVKPLVTDLFNKTKTNTLVDKIEGSNVPEDIKEFLKYAAHRHCEFNFEKIAEYYAQSDREIQELFEESALVLLDLKDAIANNFVELNDNLATHYLKEYGDK
jgi:hypothetical protein